MNHQEVRKRMGEYLQGDLTLSQRALFDAHLDGCEACSGELRGLRDTVGLLRELPGPEVPPHLANRVIARIQDGEGRERWWDGLAAFWDTIDPARYLPPLAGAALTTAVVIVGVRDLGWEIPGLSAPEPTGAEVASVLRADEAARSDAGRSDAAAVRRFAQAPAAAAPAERRLAPDRSPNTVVSLPSESGRVRVEPNRVRVEPNRVRVEFGDAPLRLIQRPLGASAADGPGVASLAEALSPDDHLALALEAPVGFLERFHAVAPDGRDAWLQAVVDRARERGQAAEVAAALRATGGDEAHAVAIHFEAAAQAAARER